MQQKKTRVSLILSVILVVLVTIGFIYISLNNSKQNIENNTQKNNSKQEVNLLDNCVQENPDVILVGKKNVSDETKTDIYFKDPKTNYETFFITLSNIPTRQSCNAEYHNGNLYVIQGTTEEYIPNTFYKTPKNYAVELWKYDKQKNGVKIFSAQKDNALEEFRVSNDEKFVAIITTKNKLFFTDNDGTILKDFGVISTGNVVLNSIEWVNSDFWAMDIDNISTAKDIFKINAINFEVTNFDVADSLIPAFSDYFVFNPTKEIIAFDDYPKCDSGSCSGDAEYNLNMKLKVHLMIYNLKTKTQKYIAESIAKHFAPKWTDENTLEYNNPNGSGRIIKQIP